MSVVKNQVDSKHIYCIDSKTCSRFIESTVDLYFAAMIKMTSSCISDYSKLLTFLRHDATKQSWLFIYCFAYMTDLNFFYRSENIYVFIHMVMIKKWQFSQYT